MTKYLVLTSFQELAAMKKFTSFKEANEYFQLMSSNKNLAVSLIKQTRKHLETINESYGEE